MQFWFMDCETNPEIDLINKKKSRELSHLNHMFKSICLQLLSLMCLTAYTSEYSFDGLE